jgi:hypothetical protein
MGSCEVGFELGPSLFNGVFFVLPVACAHEVPLCEYLCIPNVHLLWVTNKNTPCFRIVSTILDLLE